MAAPPNMAISGLPHITRQRILEDMDRLRAQSTSEYPAPPGTPGASSTVPLTLAETNATDEDTRERQQARRNLASLTMAQRIQAMRDYRMREAERARQAENERDGNLVARFRSARNNMDRWRSQHLGMILGGGRAGAHTADLEGQHDQDLAGIVGGGMNAGTSSETTDRTRSSGGKSRREREEGATLFGPNLANYFGSGSSSSGAVSGASVPSSSSAAAATQTDAGDATQADPLSSTTQTRRPRLGSRGRARGASLSGLSHWPNGPSEQGNDPLSDPAAPVSSATVNEMAMAEGIELDTLRRWIDRSSIGGATEVPGLEAAQDSLLSSGNAMCSTLQSYVNLKRNTMRLNAAASSSNVNGTIAGELPSHLHTHNLQFEYDCAAPFAGVQVFVRSSRKHGSWVAWTAQRETLGMSSDLTLGADDADDMLYAQRGPPPHILGWPVHASKVAKGFAAPVKVQLALQLNLYAPPKASLYTAQDSQAEEVLAGDEAIHMPAPPPAALIPETPGLDANRRLEDAVTPAAAARPDPLATFTAPALPAVNESTASNVAQEGEAPQPVEETREQRLAREKNERETLKVAIIIEALDEDGRPLREPNLQTSYLRLASMPLRSMPTTEVGADQQTAAQAMSEQVDALAEDADARGTGEILDVAMPSAAARTSLSPSLSTQRVWSVQVEGQEAEIGPHRFQLQELYGLSSRPPPRAQQTEHAPDATEGDAGEDGANTADADFNLTSLGDDDNAGANECLICLSAPPTTLLLPCTHGLCLDCAVQLRDTVKATRETERRRGRRPKRKYACPVCRRVYTNMLHLRAVDEKAAAQAAST